MCLIQGEIPNGDIILKGLKLKNIKFCSLFCQKTSKSVSQLHVFTQGNITKSIFTIHNILFNGNMLNQHECISLLVPKYLLVFSLENLKHALSISIEH